MVVLDVNRMIRRALTVEWDGCRPEQWGDFCVVDGARSREIYDAIHRAGEESACLYDGALPPVLARVAPYVVRLHSGSSFTKTFYTRGWNHAWGIVLRAPCSLGAMRRHLRTINYVKSFDGRKLLFRYYDPRVLRVFLPTCDRQQLQLLFGPIGAFVLESEQPSQTHTFYRDDRGELLQQLIDASGEPAQT